MCPLLVQRTHGFAELLGKQDLEKMELLSIPCAYLELLSFPSFFFFQSHCICVVSFSTGKLVCSPVL